MNRFLLIALLMLVALPGMAQDSAVKAEIQQTLERFLHGASINDAEIHQSFWAEELVYTSSSGQRFGKTSLMAGTQQSETLSEDEVTAWYSAEDLQVQQVGEVVIINFTLVSEPTAEGDIQRFLNTGVMIQRDQRWQAINWNATRKADD